ncbi:DNA polymerase III subunit delta [Francisellaceae bacterium]|nr:DNA polymerase III subunit delta [Francisellaceae bacterium]
MKSDFFHYLSSVSRSLPKIILISGDEPFQKEYILQSLLKLAEDKSLEIVRHSTENKLEAEWLYSATTNLSLFNDQRLFIIRLNKLPETSTQKLLVDFFNENASEDYFVFILPKLPAKSQKQRWYQLIEKKGLHIPVWQPNISDAIRILKYKTLQEKMNIDHDAIMLLAHSYEGNMLAACQLLDKIMNIIPNKENLISLEDVKAQLSSSRRYDVFNLADMLLLGQAGKVVQILNNLEKSDAEPSIILWALTKEARILIKLKKLSIKSRSTKGFSK